MMYTLQRRRMYNKVLKPVVMLAPFLEFKALADSWQLRTMLPPHADQVADDYLHNPGVVSKFNRSQAIRESWPCLVPGGNWVCVAQARYPVNFDPYTCTSRAAVYKMTNKHSATARWTLVHNYQNVKAKRAQTFDYGDKSINLKTYGSETPIPWTFKDVSNPYIAFIYSRGDQLALYEGVQNFKRDYPNGVSSGTHFLPKV